MSWLLRRVGALVLALALCTGADLVAAQEPAPGSVAPDILATGPASEPPADAALDPALVERVIRVLEDETARAQVLDTLRALEALETPPTAEESLVGGPLNWLRAELDRRVDAVEESVEAVVRSTGQITYFGSWVTGQLSIPSRRAFWLVTLAQMGAVLAVGTALGLLLRRGLRNARAAFESYAPPTPFHFAGALVLHATVRLIPIGLFVVGAAATAYVLGIGAYTAAVTRSLVEGLAFVTALTGVVRAVLNVKNPHMRLFPVEETTGLEIQRNAVRVIAVGGYGYFGLQAARALGLPWTLHGFFEHLLFLATVLLFTRLVLRFRRRGADGLKAFAAAARAGLVGRFLPWVLVARVWHLGAIAFALAMYGAWALQIAGGPAFLIRAMVASLAIVFLARLFTVWLTEREDGNPPPRPGEDPEDGELADAIARAAQSPVVLALKLLIGAASLVLILQAWSIDVLGWLASDGAAGVRDAATTSALTLGAAYALWRLLSGVMRAAIDETDTLGRPLRSNRTRTLLAIGRNVAFVVIWVTVTMLVLSELGVNLAPLLAGAGVIGLAIGFGSQQLVQDIITGFFILIEDTIAVGDVADLGGKAGVVEAISLRTVRLRAYDGQVHTIPFSQIATISNLTKDFSYYVFDIGVAYKEDVDRVMAVMAEVGRELAHDRAFRRLIVAPLEIAGVDRFGDNAVIIKARIKTRPLQQWTVGREYNRRLKIRFDAEGIEIPFPQRTLHLDLPPGANTAVWPAVPEPGQPGGA